MDEGGECEERINAGAVEIQETGEMVMETTVRENVDAEPAVIFTESIVHVPPLAINTPQAPRRRSRDSSISLPSAELFLSVFRTPSKSSKSSPASQDMSLPSSDSSVSPSNSCCSSSSGSGGKDCELCAICLSPLKSKTKERPMTQTSCKHVFHTRCLQESKQNCRSECPLCRSVLSPVAFLRYDRNSSASQSEQNNSSDMAFHNMRGAVVAAASRGREAVRRAMMMRAMNNAAASDNSTTNTMVPVSS